MSKNRFDLSDAFDLFDREESSFDGHLTDCLTHLTDWLGEDGTFSWAILRQS